MRRWHRGPWLLPILGGLLLLPTVVVMIIELGTLATTRDLLREAWTGQADALLFSINQQGWETSNAFATQIDRLLTEGEGGSQSSSAHSFSPFHTVFCTDSTGVITAWLATQVGYPGIEDSLDPRRLITERQEQWSRLRRWSRLGYRRFEIVPCRLGSKSQLCLVYAVSARARHAYGFLIAEPERFIAEALGPRLRELARNGIGAVVRDRDGDSVQFRSGDPRQGVTRPLTLPPTSTIELSVSGKSPDDLTQSLIQRNLLILGGVTLLLLAAVIVLFRGIRHELRLARLKSEFTANVSHELRTPLSLIRMYAETLVLDRVRDEEKKRSYLQTILSETERLTRLVHRILNFSRMDAGRRPYHPIPTELRELVNTTVRDFAPEGVMDGHRIDVHLPDAAVTLRVDPDALGEALYNLLDNAVKYSPGQDTVTVSLERTPAEATLSVRDAGIGIPAHLHETIFEQFYRASDPLIHETKGSGLGLTIVRHILESHGARITVSSAPGAGSTFTMHFPSNLFSE